MTRRPLVAGNWKMHMSPAETVAYVERFLPRLGAIPCAGEVVIAPPLVSLHAAAAAVAGSDVGLAAQNTHWEDEGPFTGEVSAPMIAEIGCRYVLVGHSERRTHFGETDRRVNQKIRAVLQCGMTPILCVGEQEAERLSGRTQEVVDSQLKLALANQRLADGQSLVVAYEPVWAIGTGRNATPAEAAEVHTLIRNELTLTFGEKSSGGMRVLYGGSVTRANAAVLLETPGIDGVLVGGASLDPESFAAICHAAR